jgi:hypothetical protein
MSWMLAYSEYTLHIKYFLLKAMTSPRWMEASYEANKIWWREQWKLLSKGTGFASSNAIPIRSPGWVRILCRSESKIICRPILEGRMIVFPTRAKSDPACGRHIWRTKGSRAVRKNSQEITNPGHAKLSEAGIRITLERQSSLCSLSNAGYP